VFPQLLLAAGAPTAAFDSQAPPLQNLSSFSKMVRMFSAAPVIRLPAKHPHLDSFPSRGYFGCRTFSTFPRFALAGKPVFQGM
jgi:hypothetical protein